MVKDEKNVVESTKSQKNTTDKKSRTRKKSENAQVKQEINEINATVQAVMQSTMKALTEKKSETAPVKEDKAPEQQASKKRVRRSDLPERSIIREKVCDWTPNEVRSAQSRLNDKMKVLNFKLDPRNADLLDRFVDSNGLGKALTVDLAIHRFLVDVEDKAVAFPYTALATIDIKEDENVSFKISETTKNRLDKFAKTNRQQAQLVVNIALECFFNEVRNVM